MHRYTVCESERSSEELGKYRTYGLVCREEDGRQVLIADVSLNRCEVEAQAQGYNEMELSTIHIYEAIEDYFGE